MKTKTILITGGTSGLGREMALLLHAQGHRVFAASRKPPIEPMPDVPYVPLDVRSSESIQACLAQTGPLDVLINNAGYLGPAGASEEIPLEDVRALFETNFLGVVQTVNAVLPAMRARRSGLIINISSAAGRMGVPPFFGFYTASKHAIEGYSKALSAELRPLGIHVALIEPGYYATNLQHTMSLPGNPVDDFAERREHVAALDRFCLEHGRNPRQVAKLAASLINGTPLRLRYPVGLDTLYTLTLYTLLPEKLVEWYLSWLLTGGQPVRLTDDEKTVRRKIGFRRFLFESAITDRLVMALVVLLAVLGWFFLLRY